jgi:ribonuclease G
LILGYYQSIIPVLANKDLIISSHVDGLDIALLEDRKLVEFHKEGFNKNFSVGDIYLGKVKKIVSGLNATFVDVGANKDAFLHYLDLGPQLASLIKYVKGIQSGKVKDPLLSDFTLEGDIDKNGKIKDVLSSGLFLPVQIAKEPISTKGPRITSEITIAGRYLVLVPFSDRISVSQKIESKEERDRLKRLVSSIKPKNFGVIIRTVAENKKAADIDTDLKNLLGKWKEVFHNLKNATPPKKLLGEIDRSSAIIRDLLNASFNSILIDDESLFTDLKDYVKSIAPEREKILKFHKADNPLFEQFGINRQIKGLFGKHVIEHTEALHVIDVNSGNTSKPDKDQETNAMTVNLEAAQEIARQLRLRDMGGIIVIDFIDVRSAENKRILLDKMHDAMRSDRAKHNILPLSKFGLMEITRQRVRPEMDIKTAEVCPSCNGSGEIQASILLIDEIENALRYIIEEIKPVSLSLHVHPFVEAFLKKGYNSHQLKWFIKYKKRIKIKSSTAYHLMEYHFINGQDEEIVI